MIRTLRQRGWPLHPSTLAAVASAVLALAVSGCDRNERFNVGNARAHVERLAGAIGSRPAGSPANEKARAYLIETLQLYGFDVRVQEADAVWPEAGVTARVANIIAVRRGADIDAVGLIAHYDSVRNGPGAGDDGMGTAVVLEAARVLAARPSPRYSLMVVLTDAEELGMMGARALIDDPEIRARLKTYINVESVGTGEPVVLFETGPGTSPALRAWAHGSRPRGGSYMQSIYDVLPNDTDFTVLRRLPGSSGINLAAAGDSYAYHTDRDRPDRLATGALAHAGTVVLDVVDGLDAQTSLAPQPAPSMYFSVLNRTAFVWRLGAAVVAGGLFALLGLVVWVVLIRRVASVDGWMRVVMTLVWATIASGAVLGALLAAAWLVRLPRAELHPWYASPMRLFVFMTVMMVAVTWVVRRFAAAVPARLSPEGSPLGVWIAVLPVWVVLSVTGVLYAPAAAYLVWLPLATAAVLLPLALWLPAAARLVSAVVLIVAWTLWVPDLLVLLPFAVAVLGRLPIVTPLYTYPALFMAAGLVIWPPVLGLLVGRLQWRMRHGLAGAVLAASLAATGALAVTGAAYSPERPLRRSATFVDDRVRGTATWELSSNEPGVDIAAGAPPNVQWRPRTGVGLAQRVGALPHAFTFAGQVSVPGTPLPFTVSASVVRRSGDADVEVTVTPTDDDWPEVAFVLPEAVVPTRSSLAGRTRFGRWQAWHANLPRDGLTWRATVPASQADRLASAEVWVTGSRLPGSVPGSVLPAWLSTPRTAWSTRHTIMIGITPSDVTQAQPLELGTSQYAATPLGKVHYLDRGAGGRAVVFLHGWGGAAALWREQLPVVQDQRALFVDLPGHGRSEAPDARYDMASQATAVGAVLDAAGVQQAVIVGHSMGALIGWHLAVRDPARVVGLVSVHGSLLPPAGRSAESDAYLQGLQAPDYDALISATLQTLFTPATPAPLRDEVTGLVRRTPALALVRALQDLGIGEPYAPGVYAGPVLALTARTAASPGNEESLLRQRFDQLDYRTFADGGHYLMLERAREVNDAIAGFLLGRGLLR